MELAVRRRPMNVDSTTLWMWSKPVLFELQEQPSLALLLESVWFPAGRIRARKLGVAAGRAPSAGRVGPAVRVLDNGGDYDQAPNSAETRKE